MLKKSADELDPALIADRIEFAAALTALRESAGLTVRELAKAAAVPTATVSGYLSGRHLPSPTQPEALVAVLAACGVPSGGRSAWLAALRRVRQAPGRRRATARSPYPGLASFEAEDAGYFFGRTEMVADIRAVLTAVHEGRSDRRMVVLIGPSGSGKTSVLLAGVLPVASGIGVRPIVMTPGENPAARLTAALAGCSGLTAPQVEDLFERRACLAPLLADREPVLLVVDQAEEMFTVCDPLLRAEFLGRLRRWEEAADPAGTRRVIVLLALRSDFYAAASEEPVLLPALRHAQIVVSAMTRDELTEAIVAPAAAVGLHVEEALVQTLLEDLAPRDRPGSAHDRGALPLLAHALHATWLVSRRGRMTVDDYQATGGITRAVERTAEAVWAGLDEHSREVARRIFLRLVFVDDESAVTRRRVRRSELRGLDAPGADISGPERGSASESGSSTSPVIRSDDAGRGEQTVTDVIERFADARLLTLRTDEVEISHEALIGAWSRLHDWIDADRSALRAHRQLGDAARIWSRAGADNSYLLSRGRLAVAKDLLRAHRVPLNETEQAFIDASTQRVERRRAAKRRRRLRLRLALAAAAVLAVLASGLAVVALRAEAVANERAAEAAAARDDAQSRELAIAADRLRESEPALAAQLSLVAYRVAPTVDARSALLDSTAQALPTRIAAQQGPTFVAVDRAHAVMAVTQAVSGAVALWSIADPHAPVHLADLASAQPGVQQFSVAISPDGRQLAAGGAAGLVQRWDISDPRHPRPLPGPGVSFPSGVLALAYSPDGRQLAAGGEGGVVQRWSVEGDGSAGSLPTIPAADLIGALAWSSDGGTLWAGDGVGTVTGLSIDGGEPIDAPDGVPGVAVTGASGSNAADAGTTTAAGAARADGPSPQQLTTGPSPVSALAVSPDGTVLAAGTKRGELHVWRRSAAGDWTADTRPVARLAGWLDSISFAPDGDTMALGGTGNDIRVVSAADLSDEVAMTAPGPVTATVFAGDGALVTGSSDGFARLWPVPGPVIGPLDDYVFGLAEARDGRLIVGPAAKAGVLASYDLADRDRPVASFAKPADSDIRLAGVVAASPDGAVIAMGAADGRVQLWNAADPRHPRPVGPAFQGAGDYVDSLAFSADGSVLAVGSDAQVIDLWSVADAAHPVHLFTSPDAGGQVTAVRFQPGGRLLAAATTGGNVQLWNVADAARPRKVANLTGLAGYVWSADFSRDGTVLAAAGSAREIRLWDVRDPAKIVPIGAPITGPVNDVGTVRFDPAGTELAAATYSGVVWVWDLKDPARPELLVKARSADGVLYGLAWSPNGATFSAAGSARKVWTWTADPDQAADEVCAAAGAGITADEWQLYVHDLPYTPPCG